MVSFDAAIAPLDTELAPLRHEVARFLASTGWKTATDDALLILSELCTNAIEAAATRGRPIFVRVDPGEHALEIEVCDSGPGFDLDQELRSGPPPWVDERGRGLRIVGALADRLTVSNHRGQTVVRAVVRRGA